MRESTMKWFGVLITVGAGFMLAGCGPYFSTLVSNEDHGGGFVKYDIELKPKKDGTVDLPPGRNCSNTMGPKKGCVGFEEGTYGVIIFSLGGRGRDNATCDEAGVNWVITQIRLTDTSDPVSGKGTGFGTSLLPWLTSAVWPFKEVSSGTVYEESWNTGRTTVAILNRNNNPAATPKDFWYQVVATKCRPEKDGTHKTATTDPRVENKGL